LPALSGFLSVKDEFSMKIILVSYALSPSRGSEGAVGWGWASGLARIHDVTVVSRAINREDVESYLKQHPELKFRVHWVSTGDGTESVIAHRTYLKWLRLTSKLCKELTSKEKFDMIQLVSYGTISVPVDLWDCGVPFVLGPVGGGQTLNPIYQEVLGTMPLEARLRNLRIKLLPYHPLIRRTAQKAGFVLATNRETEDLARRCGARTILFNATGIREEFLLDEPPVKQKRPGLRMLWVGRMLYRKGVPLALRAMKVALRRDLTLDLVGAGPMESRWRAMVDELGLKKQVVFHGQVPFERVFDFYDQADLFVFPSVNDSFGSQLLEAASRGLPILALNHQGADVLIPDSVAWKVPVDSVNNTINGMAEAMSTLADSPQRLSAMSIAALQYARTESWPRRVVRMSKLYEQLLPTATAESASRAEECPT
jgi:glycosyltransferase involved in cell wall biosynthesis